MLSTLQKADILVRAGIAVPPLPQKQPDSDDVPLPRRQEVDRLYVSYAAARAAQSLRESEAERTMAALRIANTGPMSRRDPNNLKE